MEELYNCKNNFSEDTYEALEWVGNGFEVDEVIREILDKNAEGEQIDENDYKVALHNSNSQKSFIIVDGEEELKRIMAEPLEKWRVFLHPTQNKIVHKNYSGPARVLGGAGTGKTVVAMHRAKQLASRLEDNQKVLFTTYTSNLAGDIKNNLRKICTSMEMARIDVTNLDAWMCQFLREQGYEYQIIYDIDIKEIWEEATAYAGNELGLLNEFYEDEWKKVVQAQEAYTKEQYLKASRIGTGIRLDRKKRMQVWKVFEEYINILNERQLRDAEFAMYECRQLLTKQYVDGKYQSIIVDEGQDLSMSAYRLLRALAGPEHENDLFIVGDTHQRIYKHKPILSKCGINIRGRSSYLKINYRTTEEIRKYAFSLLQGIAFDDLDESYDDGKLCQSLTHGQLPESNLFQTAEQEMEYIINRIKELHKNGIDYNDICIVARTHKLLDGYIEGLAREDIRCYEIKKNKVEDRTMEGIRVATMHRIKGLEFEHVFIVAVNERVLPRVAICDIEDPVAVEEIKNSEKCLLYVALTRARKGAYISGYGKMSEFVTISK